MIHPQSPLLRHAKNHFYAALKSADSFIPKINKTSNSAHFTSSRGTRKKIARFLPKRIQKIFTHKMQTKINHRYAINKLVESEQKNALNYLLFCAFEKNNFRCCSYQ